MKIFTSIPPSLPHTALTIGFFDGVHSGHQTLLRLMRQKGSHTTVLTFINHPLQIVKPEEYKAQILTPWPLKLAFLEQYGVDAAILLPFTREFASMSYDALLSSFSLSHLILGEGSAFGKQREGNAASILPYAQQKGFEALYISKQLLEGEPISSSRIRSLIQSGDLAQAERLLGRPFVLSFPGQETEIAVKDLCLPPDGSYSVRCGKESHTLEIKTGSAGRRLILTHPFPTQTLLTLDSNLKEAPHV